MGAEIWSSLLCWVDQGRLSLVCHSRLKVDIHFRSHAKVKHSLISCFVRSGHMIFPRPVIWVNCEQWSLWSWGENKAPGRKLCASDDLNTWFVYLWKVTASIKVKVICNLRWTGESDHYFEESCEIEDWSNSFWKFSIAIIWINDIQIE